jgi:flagellar basal body rod protein FlgB
MDNVQESNYSTETKDGDSETEMNTIDVTVEMRLMVEDILKIMCMQNIMKQSIKKLCSLMTSTLEL